MFISPLTESARASASACRSISATIASDRLYGGIEHALSPEWTPASSICWSTPATTTSVPSAIASTSRSEEHTSELQSLMRISYAVFCLKKKKHELNYTLKTTTHA